MSDPEAVLEPEIEMLDISEAPLPLRIQISQAISLKRIADTLEAREKRIVDYLNKQNEPVKF
jgi:hypothetical protein